MQKDIANIHGSDDTIERNRSSEKSLNRIDVEPRKLDTIKTTSTGLSSTERSVIPSIIMPIRNNRLRNEYDSLNVEVQSCSFNSRIEPWRFGDWTGRLLSNNSVNNNIPKYFHKFESVLGHINQYILFEEIGRGAQGTVYKCLNRDNNCDYAIKCLERASLKKRRLKASFSHSNLRTLKNEIIVMKQINHPNVVKLHEVIDDVENDRLYLVMDFVQGGSVMGDNDIMNCSSPASIAVEEDQARKLFYDFVMGMEHLHAKGILHRDIKPSNLLIQYNTEDGVPRCQVCDFGVSTLCSDIKSAKILGEDDLLFSGEGGGTLMMMSPEAIGDTSGSYYHGRPADVWAAGMTLFIMLTGTLPFKCKEGESMQDLSRRIKEDIPVFPSKPRIGKDAKKIISKMLNKDSETRITFSLLLQDLWFMKLRTPVEVDTPSVSSTVKLLPSLSQNSTLLHTNSVGSLGSMSEVGNSFDGVNGVDSDGDMFPLAGSSNEVGNMNRNNSKNSHGSHRSKPKTSPFDKWFSSQTPFADFVGRRLNRNKKNHIAETEIIDEDDCDDISSKFEKSDFSDDLLHGNEDHLSPSVLCFHVEDMKCKQEDVSSSDTESHYLSNRIASPSDFWSMHSEKSKRELEREELEKEFIGRLVRGAGSRVNGNNQSSTTDNVDDKIGCVICSNVYE